VSLNGINIFIEYPLLMTFAAVVSRKKHGALHNIFS